MEKDAILDAVQQKYGSIARGEQSGCGCGTANTAIAIGYSPEEVALGEGANLGLGCGNPLALAEVKPGMTVLDLGAGAGFDAFLAWRVVGPTGRVIGVDMTDDMLARARANAEKVGATNVEFRKGFIEKLPVEDASVDFIISNCVINLSPDKPAVFREMARVLKPGGRFAVSDIVLLKQLPESIARDVAAYVGCISGASLIGDYIRYALEAGLSDLQVKEVKWGVKLAQVLMPGGIPASCCGGATEAAEAIASIKLHGSK
ncbi:MAG: arsenite methyltransferase [Acidobacteriia bacterium]|nr:arsenite methyltransferase [Terriglobia bacterium]